MISLKKNLSAQIIISSLTLFILLLWIIAKQEKKSNFYGKPYCLKGYLCKISKQISK